MVGTRSCPNQQLNDWGRWPVSLNRENDHVRYEPDETPPRLVTVGGGLQAAAVIVAPVVLTVVIVARIAEQPDSYIS